MILLTSYIWLAFMRKMYEEQKAYQPHLVANYIFVNFRMVVKSLLVIVMGALQGQVVHVRRSLLLKIHQYLKDRTLNQKYASAYALCAVDPVKDIAVEVSISGLSSFFWTSLTSILICHLVLFGVQDVSWMFEQFKNLDYDYHVNMHCESLAGSCDGWTAVHFVAIK